MDSCKRWAAIHEDVKVASDDAARCSYPTFKCAAWTTVQIRRQLMQSRKRQILRGSTAVNTAARFAAWKSAEEARLRSQSAGPFSQSFSGCRPTDSKALKKFKKIVRFIIVFMKWIMAMREEAAKTGGGGSEAITGLSEQNFASPMVTPDGQVFDVTDFQSKKEILLSQEVRNALNQHPTLRTKEMIELAKYGLQHVKSYSEYPLHMQEKLATVAYFQEVEAKRVIIREGHTAENFYFILSGTAFVTKLVKDDETGQTHMEMEATLKKGDSFGEMELLHHSERAVTVVSQSYMTLLTVGRNDFFAIFMESQERNELPEHIKFLSTLEAMKGFPLEKLVTNPEKCLLHFFRRGDLVVKDSVHSEWLYFIKTGTCQVLKSLKSFDQKKTQKPSRKQTSGWRRGPTDFSVSLPQLGTGAQSSRTNCGFKSKLPPKPVTPKQRMERSSTPSSIKVQDDFLAKDMDSLPLLMMEAKLEADAEFKEQHDEMLAQMDIPMEPTTPHRYHATHNAHSKAGFTRSKFKNIPSLKAKAMLPVSPPYYAKEGLDSKRKVHFDVTEESVAEDLTADENASTLLSAPAYNKASTLSATSRTSSLMKKFQLVQQATKKELAPVFVQVDLLKPRDIFGLANIKFDEFHESNDLSVSLVSRGSECIMVEKKFFISHTPTKVRHAMMTLVRTYPEADTLQGNLEVKDHWEIYRHRVLKKTQEDLTEKREFHRSMTLSY